MLKQIDTSAGAIAEQFVAARKAGRALAEFPGALPTELAAAYAIQDAAIALRGEAVAGWKIGRIHAPRAEELGTTRLMGPVFASQCTTLASDSEGVGYAFAGGFSAIEAELMLRLRAPTDPAQRHYTLDEAMALVETVHIGFEMASSPFAGINVGGPLVTIADFGNNNGLIIGPEIADWRSVDLDDIIVSMQIDGRDAGFGTAAAFPDGVAGSLRAMLENLAWRGIPVTPGTWVSSGAVSGVHEISVGQRAEACFAGVDTIKCRIETQSPA